MHILRKGKLKIGLWRKNWTAARGKKRTNLRIAAAGGRR
jgi:hypothetical protein